MADKFVCTDNPKHVNTRYSGQDGDPLTWYECAEHPGRVKSAPYETLYCEGHVCGGRAKDHPSTPQRLTNQVEGFKITSHSYEGDGGPCQEPVALGKLVGFLCVECGAPLEGMPVKD